MRSLVLGEESWAVLAPEKQGPSVLVMDHTETGEDHRRTSLSQHAQQQQRQQHLDMPPAASAGAMPNPGLAPAPRSPRQQRQQRIYPGGSGDIGLRRNAPGVSQSHAAPGGHFSQGHEADYHAQPNPHAYPMHQQYHPQPPVPAGYGVSQPPPRFVQQAQIYHQNIPMHQQHNMHQLPPPIEHQPNPHSMAHPQHQPYIQPTAGRLPADRPLIKLSVSLIDTYKLINKVYYEERDARRAARAAAQRAAGEAQASGVNNYGWDDDNYDYIITNGETFNDRYMIKGRIGKGSFGQVVRAVDIQTKKEVAIKIIKSKKPFLMQAKTEIKLLMDLCEKDHDDDNNIVRLVTHFMYRNHQCLVFEMLSLNLYELLKNTQFGGVSLNLIRKFAKQILKSLAFLARPDVDIIHCDLKPENILLRHPKRSGVKVIDFGSSCRSDERMYSYIQSRFYRSPEVMLGLPYSVAIDMWSLGCILVEMHTGEPLFSGSDQFDQMQKIVKVLGMLPNNMLDQSGDNHRLQFFERRKTSTGEEWAIKQENDNSASSTNSTEREIVIPSADPIASLAEVVGAETSRKKKYPPTEPGHSARNYDLFVDLIHGMLAYDPQERIKPDQALRHPFILAGESTVSTTSNSRSRS
mmetsp:Transcript_18494/g.26605  ORF Transcript_18494/g.26605 Transcript_18494/m.26605 type:complete len:633 (-) Transcript_18494:701-2599(-)